MQRLTKRGIWISLFVIIGALTAWGIFAFSRPTPPEVITDTVKRLVLTQTVEATGGLESIDEVELSSDISGTIEEVFVEVGDLVVAGEILARLDSKELRAQVEQARETLRAAEARLAEKNAGATSEAILVAMSAVDVAKAALSQAETDLAIKQDDLLQVKETTNASVREAEVALANLRAENAQELLEVEQDLIVELQDVMVAIRSGLSQADEVIGIDNSLANDGFEDVLSVLNSQALISAENSYRFARESRDKAETAVFLLTNSATISEIEAAETQVEKALQETVSTLFHTRLALDATNVDDSAFSATDLSNLKTDVDNARTTVAAAQSNLLAQQQLIASTEISVQTSENTAEQKLASALVNQTSSVTSANSAVRAAESLILVRKSDLVRAEAQLAEVSAGPRFVDVAALQADVRRARAEVDAIEARLEKAEIMTPIAGRVSEIALEVGEQVFETETVIIVQTTENQFRILANVAESDIAKVAVNDPVAMTFDAFGDDVIIPGSVVHIDPAEKTIEGVIFYEIEVAISEGQFPEGLKPGMSVDLEVLTEERKGVLAAPQRAVLRRLDGSKYVRVPGGDLFIERDVETSLRGDNGLIEILKGLTEGEEIILTIREAN